jgi:hypothetical protein
LRRREIRCGGKDRPEGRYCRLTRALEENAHEAAPVPPLRPARHRACARRD